MKDVKNPQAAPAYSAQLADEEKREAADRRRVVSETFAAVKELLCENGITASEWHEIIDLFNGINARVIPAMTIKEMIHRDA